MTRGSALLLSGAFLVLAPGTIAGLIPWWITDWRLQPPFLGLEATRWLGALALLAGLAGLADSFARFALQGLGTPAPPLPTERLVVTGAYRFVRNPMYLSVLLIVLGQALVLGDVRPLAYAILVWLAFHAFVLVYEEPTLRRTFPADYAAFTAAVPRWRPRLRPWRPKG